MPWSFIVPAAISLYTGSQNREAASRASDTATQASERSQALQKEMFDKQLELNAPYREAGVLGQNRLMELLGLGGSTNAADYGKYGRDFSMADYQADPGYAFRLGEGMKQLGRTAAGRGGLISGGTMKGLQDYAQNAASQEYSNAFNRYQTNRANQLQPLGNLMTSGQNAAAGAGAQAGAYGTNVGNLMVDRGENQANALLAAQAQNASMYEDIGGMFGKKKPSFGSLFGGGSTSGNGYYST
jgi:hypothetical protein